MNRLVTDARTKTVQQPERWETVDSSRFEMFPKSARAIHLPNGTVQYIGRNKTHQVVGPVIKKDGEMLLFDARNMENPSLSSFEVFIMNEEDAPWKKMTTNGESLPTVAIMTDVGVQLKGERRPVYIGCHNEHGVGMVINIANVAGGRANWVIAINGEAFNTDYSVVCLKQ